jgi:hypothetical protein
MRPDDPVAARSEARECMPDERHELLGLLLVDLDRLADRSLVLPRVRPVGIQLQDLQAVPFGDLPTAGARAVVRGSAGLGLEELCDVSHPRVIPGIPCASMANGSDRTCQTRRLRLSAASMRAGSRLNYPAADRSSWALPSFARVQHHTGNAPLARVDALHCGSFTAHHQL